MKLIVSYMDGSSEIISISQLDSLQFISNEIHIIGAFGNSKDLQVRDIRSIVIA